MVMPSLLAPVIWQGDLVGRPPRPGDSPLWELVLCSGDGHWEWRSQQPQAQVNGEWLRQQLAAALAIQPRPAALAVFRPQVLGLFQVAAEPLGIPVQPQRRTPALKARLRQLAQDWSPAFDPLAVPALPPVPLPESVQGEQWQFAAVPAAELTLVFDHRPIPVLDAPPDLWPVPLGLASTLPIPGVVIQGGRRSRPLAQWLQAQVPAAIAAIAGDPAGLILEAGLDRRWVLATFTDAAVVQSAQVYQQRLQASQGLHFLMVQPDDSGLTPTGFWLLQQDP
ncbi:Tab2 family RNA-binding protein [Prochlorothrix hollandica]|nr:Tab2 family RNA-binding protein [Prochlorothrix hollandica]